MIQTSAPAEPEELTKSNEPTITPETVESGGLDRSVQQEIDSLEFEKSITSDAYFQLKDTLNKLRESEEKFSKVFQKSSYAIMITSVKGSKIIDINDTFTTILGYTREEALASSTTGLNLWINLNDRKSVLTDIKTGVEVRNREFQFKTKNGEVIIGLFSAQIIHISGEPYILSSIADITEEKAREEKVQEVFERDEAILQSIDDAVFACDKDGKIIVFNRVAEELTGITAKAAIGLDFDKIITFANEKDGKISNDFIFKTINNNKTIKISNDTLLVKKDGTTIPVAESVAPIKDNNGDIIGCVVVFYDVTEERQIGKAKTEFVSLTSHQLRTPLTALNWISETLSSTDKGELSKKQKKYIEKIVKASGRMTLLVNTLLNVSCLELGTLSIEPESVIVEDIGKNCLKELSLQISKKKLIINEKYDKKNPAINADPKLLWIVLENLLTNAVKYTPKGGYINLTFSKEKDNYLLIVNDTGIGIPKNDQGNIFTKLHRADNVRVIDQEGNGLGLYIVKGIVDQSGGKIWFKSTEGKGTTMYVTWPLIGMAIQTGIKKLI